MEIFVTSQMFEMFIEEHNPRSGRTDSASKFEKRLTQAAFNLDLTAPSGLKPRLIFKEGHLTKLGGKSKQKGWQDRYFVLDSTTLSYYRSKNVRSIRSTGRLTHSSSRTRRLQAAYPCAPLPRVNSPLTKIARIVLRSTLKVAFTGPMQQY